MWTVVIPSKSMELMGDGKTLELLVEGGLVTVERADEGAVVIRFLTREEAGLRF